MNVPNETALRGLLTARPAWVGMCSVQELLPETIAESGGQLLLHAGPPFTSWDQVPAPVRHSMALAAVFEGWYADVSAALAAMAAGAVSFGPAQDHNIVVPLAGIASPSMALHIVQDLATGSSRATSYSVINEGMVHALRLGSMDQDLPEHHRWLNSEFANWLGSVLTEPIDLYTLIEQSLDSGDDGHSNTVIGSQLLAGVLRGRSSTDIPKLIDDFLRESAAFALNLWMAAAALALQAGSGVAGSSLLTRAGGNGVDFGIQVSGLPGRWFTTAATPPLGDVDKVYAGLRAVGAIGDSAVVDVIGLGGAALNVAPSSVERLGKHLPHRALDRPRLLLSEQHGPFGAATGLTAQAVVREELSPVVLLGMIESSGLEGRIGGGAYEPPIALFEKALAAVAQPTGQSLNPAS